MAVLRSVTSCAIAVAFTCSAVCALSISLFNFSLRFDTLRNSNATISLLSFFNDKVSCSFAKLIATSPCKICSAVGRLGEPSTT